MGGRVVVIVGSPNVGKSALFNRLVGGHPAIVTSEPGTTRDRLCGTVRSVPTPFLLVDTGGLFGGEESTLARGIERQARAALATASAVLLVVDGRQGVTGADHEIAAMLRPRALPVLLVVNKLDTPSREPLALPFFELGMGEPIAVSAAHGLGIERLLTALGRALDERGPSGRKAQPEADAGAIRVALVGRPNVGKSSILNRLVGEERQLVSEGPGTTRDAVDTAVRRNRREFILVDTAGIRRRGRVQAGAEVEALARAKASIRRADVVVLVLAASEEFAVQDAHIAGYVREAHRPLVVVVNKWDLIDGREDAARVWERNLRERLRFAKKTPILLASAKTNQRVFRILDLVGEVHAAGAIRVPTPDLNRWLRETTRTESTGPRGKRPVRFLYATQTGIHPPRFVMFCTDSQRVHASLRRHLENALGERFGFGASPVLLRFRDRSGRQSVR